MGVSRIIEDDLSGPEIAALLHLHLEDMHQWSPPGTVHAMSIERLRRSDVTFFSAWSESRLSGCGALKQLDATHGEIKSMRVAADCRGQGVGESILLRLLAEARSRTYARVSLETGRPEAFGPAQRLYRRHGFEECPPFADYVDDGFSLCMTKRL